jgi:PAS domain S-box-containing protein
MDFQKSQNQDQPQDNKISKEATLPESEQKYLTLFESASDAIFLMKDNVFVDCNKKTLSMFRCTQEQIIGHFPYEFSPPVQYDGKDSKENALEKMDLALKDEPQFFEWQHAKSDGSLFDAEVSLNPVDLSSGRHLLAIVRDITDRKKAEEDLRESEVTSRALLNAITDVAALVDFNGNVINANPAMADRFNIKMDELVGCSLWDLLPGEIGKQRKKKADQVIQTGKPVRFEDQRVGTWFDNIFYPVLDKQNKVTKVAVLARDITERKKADEVLRKSEEKYRNIFEYIQDIHVETSINGFINEISPSAESILKYKREELIGKSLSELYAYPEQREKLITELKKNGSVQDYDIILKDKNGNHLFTSASGRLYFDEKGNPEKIVGSVRDITERKQVEEKLKKSEDKFRNYISNAPNGVFIVDKDGRYVEVNQAACDLLGYSEKELTNLGIPDVIHEDSLSEGLRSLQELKRVGFVKSESIFKRKDGSNGSWVVNAVKLNEDHYLGFTTDITDRKKAENTLRESEEKLQALFTESIFPIIVSIKGRHIIVNPAYLELFGYKSFDELKEIPILDLIAPSERKRVKGYVKLRAQGKDVPTFYETTGLKKDGTEFEMEVSLSTYILNDEIYTSAFFKDLTEKKKAAEKLRQKDYVIESASSAIATADLNGNMNYANPVFLEMWGFSNPNELMGKPFTEYWMIADRYDEVMSALENEGKWSSEIQAKRKDGSLFNVQVSAALVRDENGKPISLMSSSVDITRQRNAEKALREKEENLRSIIESSQDWIWSIDVEGNHDFCNPAIERILGYKPEELLGKSSLQYLHPDDRKEIETRLPFWVEQKNGWQNLVLKWYHKDGSIRWMESNAVPILDVSGELVGFRGVDRDITERKQAEKLLKESEDKYRTLYDTAFDGLLVMEGYKFIDCNQEVIKRYGFKSKKEVVGLHPWDISSKQQSDGRNSKDKAIELIDKAYNDKPQRFLWKHIDTLGKLMDVDISINKFETKGNKYLMVAQRDITEKKKTEDKLKMSEEKYRALYQNALVGLFRIALDGGKPLAANKVAADLFGYSSIEEFMEEFSSVNHYVNIKDREPLFKALHEKGYIDKVEMYAKKKDGTRIWHHGSFRLVKDEGYVECVAVDITQQKKAEEALKKYQNDLKRLSAQQIKTQEEERKHLSRELHDELGQELTAIKINLNSIETNLPENIQENIQEKISDTNNLADNLIDQIHNIVLDLRPNMLDDLGIVTTLKWHCNRFSKRQNIPVKFSKSQLQKRLQPDYETVLYRITQETLTNISKHAQAKNVKICLEQSAEMVTLTIEDDGVGFNAEEVKTRDPEKSGFGLLGIQERVSVLNGQVDINSTPKKGTCISIRLLLEETV